LTYGGTLTVAVGGDPLQLNDTFQLFSFTSQSGAFAATNLPALTPGLGWSWDQAAGTLTVVSAPVTPPDLIADITATDITFTWTGAYKLVAQTNTLGIGLQPTNWFDYPDGTNGVVVPVVKTNPAVFFGLQPQ
jgi:hypothetical protein